MAGEVELMPPQRKKKTDVSVAEAAERPMTPWEMLSYALKNNFPAEQLKTFTELYREWRKDDAENQYNKAIAKASRSFPVITKKNRASFGTGKASYVYEDLGEIQRAVKEPLSDNNLHYRWETDENEATGMVFVTCIVSHDGGYSVRNRLSEKRDLSGNKSNVQGLGSIVTYLQRYTLKAALGLAAAADSDAHIPAEPVKTITEKQAGEINKLFEAIDSDALKDIVLGYYKIESIAELPAIHFKTVIDRLEKHKRDAGSNPGKPGVV